MMRAAIFLLLVLASVASANFLNEPQIQWTYPLPKANNDDKLLAKGNAVVASQDDSLIFITTKDARLFRLNTSDGLPVTEAFQPPSIPDTITSCASGVALAQDATGVQYAIYAVIDTPTDDAGTIRSRIIALNADGSRRWMVILDGVVSGTPAIGADNDVIYVSHNVANSVDNGEQFRGKITVLRDNGGIPRVVADVFPEDRFGPFGPLTTKTTVSSTEIVFVAEQWGGGYEYNGYVYYLTAAGGGYALEIFSEWEYSSAAAPAVSSDAEMLWVPGVGATVGGWVGEEYSSVISFGGPPSEPTWRSTFLQANEGDNVTMDVSPVVSTDNSLLFVTGASDEVYCVEADSGRLLWGHDGNDRKYIARPIFSGASGDEGVLYTMSNPHGRIQQLGVRRGRRNWSHACNQLTGDDDCENDDGNAVEAEFSMSASENNLYYGNVDGTVVSLQVGTFATTAPETARPTTVSPTTVSPTTVSPTTRPTDIEPFAPGSTPLPTASPTGGEGGSVIPANTNTNEQASSGPSDKTTKALFAISALIAVLAVGILAYVFMSFRRRRRRKNGTLPVANEWKGNGDLGGGGADTGVPAESSLVVGIKNKSLNTSASSDVSPRLHSIAESSIEDSSVDESVDVIHDDDIENYVFAYATATVATPDTSLSIARSSSGTPQKATRASNVDVAAKATSAPDATEEAAQSLGVDAAAATVVGVTAVGAGKLLSSSASGDNGETENVNVKPSNGAEEALVHVESNAAKPYYMLDTRPGGAGAVIEVGINHVETQAVEPNEPVIEKGGDEQVASSGTMVPVDRGSRSAYALGSGSESVKERAQVGDVVPLSQDERPSKGLESTEQASKEQALSQQLLSVKSDGTMSLASIDENPIKMRQQNAMVPAPGNQGRSQYAVEIEKTPSQYFEDQSTCASMYLEDELTLATVVTHESAPIDERASWSYLTHSHVSPTAERRAFGQASARAGSPAPTRENASSIATNPRSVRLDALSPLTVQNDEDLPATNKAPAHIFKAPLSPGSTHASTSVYIEDDGSVEMEQEPVKEKETSAPASVKLDACTSQKTNGRSPESATETKMLRKSYKTSPQSKVNVSNLSSSAPKLSPPPPLSPASTSTNGSPTSAESPGSGIVSGRSPQAGQFQDIEMRGSARSLRKMRLEQLRLAHAGPGDKTDSSHSDWSAASTPKRVTVQQREIKPVTLSPLTQSTAPTVSVFGAQSQTLSNITLAPGSPSSGGSSSTHGLFPSSGSDSSDDDLPSPPAPPSQRTSRSRSTENKHQQVQRSSIAPKQLPTARLGSGVSRRPTPPKTRSSSKPRSSSQGRYQRTSSFTAKEEKKVETNEEPKPAAITSMFSGLMKHVEEAERQFFNPTLSQKKSNTRRTSKTSSNGSRSSKQSSKITYSAYSSDEEDSQPPPPPSYR